MEFKKFIQYVLFVTLAFTYAMSGAEKPTLISTTGNSVGIESNDECFYIAHTAHCKKDHIVCASGKIFGEDESVKTIMGSSTGTPPHLEFSNYIGSRIVKDTEPGKVGSGRRAIYCLGVCKHR